MNAQPDQNDSICEEDQLPGPVPVDGMEDKFIWPTWREAILDAKVGVETAYERRRRVFQAAYDAGLSFRQIAKAAGLTAPAIHKIIGKQRSKPDELLDAPAFQANGDAALDQGRAA